MSKFIVREILNPNNCLIKGSQEDCQEYCDCSNQSMIEANDVQVNEKVFEVVELN